MKKYFIVSLCENGILGGGILANDEAVTYCTGKVTVPDKFRRLRMEYNNISSVSGGWIFIFPTVTINMKNGESYKFVVFAKNKFINLLKEMGISE